MMSVSVSIAVLHFVAGAIGLIARLVDSGLKLKVSTRILLFISSILFLSIATLVIWLDVAIFYKAVLFIIYMFLSFNSARLARNKYPNQKQDSIFIRDLTLLSILATIATFSSQHLSTGLVLKGSLLIAALSLVLALVASVRLLVRRPDKSVSDFPTVSVLVPARNEDHALHECLTSLLELTYPKLEIIVLDDCSQDRTSDVVAKFARDGVRFIQGDIPESGWTGKNNALRKLVGEASGSYLFVCDVDVHLSPDALQDVVSYAVNNGKDMLTFLPAKRKLDPLSNLFIGEYENRALLTNVLPSLYQVSGRSAYLIKSSHLKEIGSVDTFKSSALIESELAKKSGKRHEVLLGRNFGATTRKRLNSIYHATIRLSYPLNHRSLSTLSIFLIWELATTLLLVEVASGSLVACATIAMLLAAQVVKLITLGYRSAIFAPFSWLVSYFVMPVFTIISMYQYEFGEVVWKRRNVCYPVLRTIPKLPKLED